MCIGLHICHFIENIKMEKWYVIVDADLYVCCIVRE